MVIRALASSSLPLSRPRAGSTVHGTSVNDAKARAGASAGMKTYPQNRLDMGACRCLGSGTKSSCMRTTCAESVAKPTGSKRKDNMSGAFSHLLRGKYSTVHRALLPICSRMYYYLVSRRCCSDRYFEYFSLYAGLLISMYVSEP